jgi:RNA polymerase sigma-70 factor, ECF subfamily
LSRPSDPFEATVLPHLDAAYNLARWLVRDEHMAQDLVHEAFIKAQRYFASFRGGDARPWLLGIVRNTCFTWLGDQKRGLQLVEFRDDLDTDDANITSDARESLRDNPEAALMQKNDRESLNTAIEALPAVFRETLILREIEGMSYDDIATVTQVPKGTVMSRLSRARALLRGSLAQVFKGVGHAD